MPLKAPPPWRTVKVTGTFGRRLKPASVTIAMNGSGSGWPTTPVCPLPVSTTIWVAAVGVPDAVNTAVPANPVASASTTLFPTPLRAPSCRRADACPLPLVVTAIVPSCADPLTRPPLFCTTRNTTAWFAAG